MPATLTLKQALPIIDAAGQCGVPVLIRGGSGIGKSSGLTRLAEVRGEHLEVVTLSLFEPSDLGGAVVVKNNEVELVAMPWLRRAVTAGKKVRILLDELNLASPETLGAALRLLLEGVAGDTELPADTTFVAAMNPLDSSAGGWELTAPVASRFLHLDVSVDVAEWAEGMLTGWGAHDSAATDPTSDLCVPVTPADLTQSLAQVTSFLLANPDKLVDQPSDPTLAAGAWPSPRKWDWAARILPRIPDRGLLRWHALAGLVGAPAADAYLTWAERLDLPATSDLLANPTSIDWAGEPADRVQAMATAVVAAAVADTGHYRGAGAVLRAAVAADRGDVILAAAKTYLRARPADVPRDTELLAPISKLLALTGALG